jgi:hypothetical protein
MSGEPPRRSAPPDDVDRGEDPTQASRARYPAEQLLLPADVAALFHVTPRTVTRWARAGKLTTIYTAGGHRRYRLSEVLAIRRGVVEDQVRPDLA